MVKITRDENDKVERENITKSWKDWIDYWAVDFDFGTKPEVIYEYKEEQGGDGTLEGEAKRTKKIVERKTGNHIFENEWQSFRTKKDKQLEFIATGNANGKATQKIAIKVVDILGNDTMKVVEI